MIRRPSWLTRRRAVLIGLWVVALVTAFTLINSREPHPYPFSNWRFAYWWRRVVNARADFPVLDWAWVHDRPAALRGWLWHNQWVWPLLITLVIVMVISPDIRAWWTRRSRRVLVSLGVAGLLGVTVLTGRPREMLLALAAVVVVGIIVRWVVVILRQWGPPLTEDELADLEVGRERLELIDARTKLRNDLLGTALQFTVALAVLAGAIVAFLQLTDDREQAAASRELTRQGQASERFTRAIDQLGSDREETRIGGIYGLEQIAQQSSEMRLAVTEVLAAYLRRRDARPAKPFANIEPGTLQQLRIMGPIGLQQLRVRAPDVHAAFTVLVRRQVTPSDPALDLSRLDLRGAFVSYTTSTSQSGRVDFTGSDFSGTDFTGADFSDVRLVAARFDGTRLAGAILDKVNLSSAYLTSADLSGAELQRMDLSSADLTGAKLVRSLLTLVSFSGARLIGADLTGAEFTAVDFTGANLTGARFRGARADRQTKWPAGFDWRGAGVELQ
jgi:uncharacterized protein YjbI with pentapeptide repeats